MDKTKLLEYIELGMSIRKIAEKENLGYSTVRYWIKKYQLHTHGIVLSTDQSKIMNDKRWGVKPKIDWVEIQSSYDSGDSLRKICEKYKIHLTEIYAAKKEKKFETRTKTEASQKRKSFKSHTQETKSKLSEIRKDYLEKNPDKHPWRTNSKFKSVPCEQLKKVLRENGIDFIEEFQPKQGKNYSVDIMIGKIGLEVNGNQHYNKDGSLRPYYQKREDFLTSIGYSMINIHYSKVYNNQYVNELIDKLKNGANDRSRTCM